jgi:SAM-dependent methyltransferase
MSMFDRFISLNKRAAWAITPPHVHEANVFGMYRKLGTMLISHPRISTVVDVGAGRAWSFPPYYKEWFNIRLIGLDIDASEMLENNALDEKIECDVVRNIPLKPGSVDLFMIHSGIEHLRDNELTFRNLFQALRPGGFVLAQFPNRYAPFAIANRLLPTRATRWLLKKFMSESAEALGYITYYDRTNYSAFRSLVIRSGFEEIYYLPGFFGSSYYGFFLPLFLCSYVYDSLCFALGIKNLASYNLWLLQKPGDSSAGQPMSFYAWH